MKKIALILIFALAVLAGPAPSLAQEDKRSQALKKYLEAKRREEAEDYTGAVASYKEAIELDPTSAELRIALGWLYIKNRNIIEAEAQAQEAMRLDPQNIEAHKLMARVLLDQVYVGTSVNKEKALAAIKELETVLKSDQDAKLEVGAEQVPALYIISQLYLSLEDTDKATEALRRLSDSGVQLPAVHYQLARLYFSKNRYREAAAAARRAYELEPKQTEYAKLLAMSLQRIGRAQEALNIYRRALGISDEKGDIKAGKELLIGSPLVLDYAEALVFAGRYDDAVKLLDPILQNIDKGDPSYLRGVGIISDALRRQGQRQEAIRTLEEALKGQDVSESLPLLYALAETHEEMQQFDKAVGTYEEALSSILNPDGTLPDREQDRQNASAILSRIALAYRMAGKRERAQETFERMRKLLGASSPAPDRLIISTLLEEGKNKEAFEQATAAIERYPDERVFKLLRAQAAGRLGDLKTAEATLNALLRGGPEDAEIYSFLASIQLEAHRLREAEESARRAMNLDPNDIGPLVTLSIVQERQKKYKESEATLRKALEIDPDNATLLNNLGYYLVERGERLAEAEEMIRRAVNIEPTNGSFLDSLGWLLFKKGKLEEARKYLEQAIIYSPRSATIHDHLGDLYKKLGQMDKARAQWQKALELATDPEEIKKIKEKLER
jgi:tetratricopeptide (TPR) repeat protein